MTSRRRNRIDPWGDLHAVASRGIFTGNRGCVVNDHEQVVRHHASSLWIICQTEFRGWRWPLARPGKWTPLFFLDEAVALAAGHRPCATCRRAEYLAYRDAVTRAIQATAPLKAYELNDRLSTERLRPGRGVNRATDRILHAMPYSALVTGTVIVSDQGSCQLVNGELLFDFSYDGWTNATLRPRDGMARVLTPPTSVAALKHGYRAVLHASAALAARH
jgi:hypothetical protein